MPELETIHSTANEWRNILSDEMVDDITLLQE